MQSIPAQAYELFQPNIANTIMTAPVVALNQRVDILQPETLIGEIQIESLKPHTPENRNVQLDANGNLTVMTDLAKTQYYTYDTSNRLTMVEAVDAGTTTRYPVASFTYDGDGGRTTKTAYPNKGATSVTTRYVGDLYESSGGAQTDYIFMGGTRVAAYDASGAKYRWFIGDNLGSTNVVLDETAAVKERIEYTPWGEVKSYDKYGTGSEVAWFYFTGKKLDDETGLVYFGARYYNPKLARFITADPTIQHPYDPQDLNRYSYCRNNPITLVDSTGYGWGSFFKAIVDTIKYIINPVKTDPVLHGVVTGDWSYATQMALNTATGFVMGGPIGAANGAITTYIMRTPIGQWAVNSTARVLVKNTGMSPGIAEFVSSFAVSTAVSFGVQKGLESALAQPEEIAYTQEEELITEDLSGNQNLPPDVRMSMMDNRGEVRYEYKKIEIEYSASSAQYQRLKSNLAAQEIAGGHAFDKHVILQSEFPGITTRQQFASEIESIMNTPDVYRGNLLNGRSAYWGNNSGTVVIRNPRAPDGGTAFKPVNGKSYIYGLQ